MNDAKQTGEMDFDKDRDKLTTNYWGSEIKTERYDISAKLGYVFLTCLIKVSACKRLSTDTIKNRILV